MTEAKESSWNSLEITKLGISVITTGSLFVLAYLINDSIREAERERIRSENQQAAVQEFSRFIYERRSRSALLLSALRRHAREPVAESLREIVERKRAYDDTYFDWNGHFQSNLLLVRQVIESSGHSRFEALVEDRLVKNIFTPIDRCLTDAYDLAIRGRNPSSLLIECGASELIQRALNCGYGITDELYRLSGNGPIREPSDVTLNLWCPP